MMPPEYSGWLSRATWFGSAAAFFLTLVMILPLYPTDVFAFKTAVLSSLPDDYRDLGRLLKVQTSPGTGELILAKGEGEVFSIGVADLSGRSLTYKIKALEGGGLKAEIFRIGWVDVDMGRFGMARRPDPLYPVNQSEAIVMPEDPGALLCRVTANPHASTGSTISFVIELTSGKENVEIPVCVRLAPVTLSRDIPITIQAAVSAADLKGRGDTQTNLIGAFSFLGNYGINSAAGGVEAEKLTNPIRFYQDLFAGSGIRKARLLFINAKKYFKETGSSPEKIATWKQSTRKTLDHYEELMRKYPNSFYIKLWDEPRESDYPLVKELYNFVNDLRLPVITELTAPPVGEIRNCAGLYIPRIEDLDVELVRQAKAAGKQIWFYANRMHSLRMPGHSMRNMGWILWAYGLDGYHFWCMNCWSDGDPYKAIYGPKSSFGRGFLVYPTTSPEIFNPSLRLEMVREGVEDYMLLKHMSEAQNMPCLARAAKDYVFQNFLSRRGRKTYTDNPKPAHDRFLEMISKNSCQ